MRAPRSYTREDVVELHVPALPWAVADWLDRLGAAGARPAQPGEFTRRAYENGRLTLDQVGAVAGLLRSRGSDEARAYAQRLATDLTRRTALLREQIEDLLALVELGLDFSTEDVVVLPLDEIRRRVSALRSNAARLSSDDGALDGLSSSSGQPRIVLAGPTNAGKSRLFNRLLGRDAALVSAQRHTTRDAVEAPWHAPSGIAAQLIDTAGGGDPILDGLTSGERELFAAAWAATRQSLTAADVILFALDGSCPPPSSEESRPWHATLENIRAPHVALLWTKSDLPPHTDTLDTVPAFLRALNPRVLRLSAASGDGIESVVEFLDRACVDLRARVGEAAALADSARRQAAADAAAALARAGEALELRLGEDVIAVELREAAHALWRIDGTLLRHDALTESTLDRIFSRFCIGK